ncbi:MAG: hypothetical protein SFV15_05275 [Polyangiaceae bacterium]|nr:hypothetical protein [Polyangiaceae bacterium]
MRKKSWCSSASPALPSALGMALGGLVGRLHAPGFCGWELGVDAAGRFDEPFRGRLLADRFDISFSVRVGGVGRLAERSRLPKFQSVGALGPRLNPCSSGVGPATVFGAFLQPSRMRLQSGAIGERSAQLGEGC